LFLQAGPLPVNLETIKIDIDEISWVVTPDWNASLGKTLTVHPSPPAAASSLNLPIPTGAVKTVTVTISGKASTAGGDLNGFTVSKQTFTIGSDAEKVSFHGPNERMGWALLVKYITDQTSQIVFNAVPSFMGINDV
jgi:hypothetical protein